MLWKLLLGSVMMKLVLLLAMSSCTNVVLGDMTQEDLDVFGTCNGKDGGFNKGWELQRASLFVGCDTKAGKYCEVTCVMHNGNFADRKTGELNLTEINKEIDEYGQMDKDTKGKLKEAFKQCSESVSGGKYLIEKKCRNMRKLSYCVYNKYVTLCNPKQPMKEVSVASSEKEDYSDIDI